MIFVKKQFSKGTVLVEEFKFPNKVYMICEGEVCLQHVEWTTKKIAKAKEHKFIDSEKQNIDNFLVDKKLLNFKTFVVMKKGNIIGEEFLYSSRMDTEDIPSKEKI